MDFAKQQLLESIEQVATVVQSLAVGDVVRLKTGGPKMTVETPLNVGPPEYQLWLCTWFTPSQEASEGADGSTTVGPLGWKLERAQFSQLSLVKVPDDAALDISKLKEDAERANEIVEGIIADLTDRHGLKHEWSSIDEETQNQIAAAWAQIVVDHLPE